MLRARDKIYPALGFAYDVGDFIIPDCKKSVAEAYADVAHFSLSNDDPHAELDFLGHVVLQDTKMEAEYRVRFQIGDATGISIAFGKRFHVGARSLDRSGDFIFQHRGSRSWMK